MREAGGVRSRVSGRLCGGAPAGARARGGPLAALLTRARGRPGGRIGPGRGRRGPGARSCDPAPPARKIERFLCTHAPGARGRLARAAGRPEGRFFYALSCALVMQSRRVRPFPVRPAVHNDRSRDFGIVRSGARKVLLMKARPPSASRPRERCMGKVEGRVITRTSDDMRVA